jgi:hypothetical protein
MRHLAWLFADLGISTDIESQRRLDASLRRVLQLPADEQCPGVWAEVKTLDGDGWAEIMHELRESMGLPPL